MQVFEVLFLALFAVAIPWLIFGPARLRRVHWRIAGAGIGLIALGALLEGWRWQMLPAQLGFLILVLATSGEPGRRRSLQAIGAAALVFLLGTSAFLAHQLPIRSLPEPQGPFAVGTFEYSVTDPSRIERFSPDRNRELYVEVWYPADQTASSNVAVESLYHELYEGDPTIWSFLFSYLRLIPTHSHIEAPIAAAGDDRFPVLLFNHGLDGFTSQNQMLMEHLASHGYVIFSIGHPYESMRVNLASAGTVRAGTAEATDLAGAPNFSIPLGEMGIDLLTRILANNEDRQDLTAVRQVLLSLADDYGTASDEATRRAVITTALESPELGPYRHFMTALVLADYLRFVYFDQARSVEYWVEDIKFIADTLPDIDAPIEGFADALDIGRLGVFGMSMGGAAAGEFCKTDARCRAGTNLDGTQGGRNWSTRVGAPFLMIYHEAHRAGNDFAYLPPTHDFKDLTVAGTTHLDFVEIAYTMPLLKTLGIAGPIDALRTIDIVNTAHLEFFDQYLKGKPVSGDFLAGFPEVSVREHAM